MTRYKNSSGNSGVSAYDIADRAIVITFADGGTYRYDYGTPGRRDVEAMKRLALMGKGLATYINQHVRERFAEKL